MAAPVLCTSPRPPLPVGEGEGGIVCSGGAAVRGVGELGVEGAGEEGRKKGRTGPGR